MAEVTIYTRMFCGFCTAAKRLLERKGAQFTEDIRVAGIEGVAANSCFTREGRCRQRLCRIGGELAKSFAQAGFGPSVAALRGRESVSFSHLRPRPLRRALSESADIP